MNMIDALCAHGALVIPVLLAINGLLVGLVGKYLNEKLKQLSEIRTSLDNVAHLHDECQKILPEKYATSGDVMQILAKIDKIAEIIQNFHLVYRTKDEAQREWKLLENRLTTLENNIDALSKGNEARHTEIWDKLNRVVDFFRDERQRIEDKLNGVTVAKKNTSKL